MAALAILGLAMFILLQAHYGALRLFGEIRDQVQTRELIARAVGLAESAVTAGELTGAGEFGKRFPEHKYRFEAQPVSEETPNLVEVRVAVEGPDVTHQTRFLVFLTVAP